ncbi:hypothetical protein CC1G_06092 [Coprinopsis cinerea okayama7|uniref:F-box domain-containing protein n=1 Tax=Coprinopsis cinerea (strain Okayama-7 / 130 / ATCC MYA-4618 / FGSC 9003) TaxID=240176 RepID=A8PA48_COPC7|nr:hypothetical protein CC1G_06092 [Coprinopsis cinerea okayama7\|eukprot:XP_001839902.1 hypothetical protein CC1G_06092 [Coprinopsis cinerea okayama7\
METFTSFWSKPPTWASLASRMLPVFDGYSALKTSAPDPHNVVDDQNHEGAEIGTPGVQVAGMYIPHEILNLIFHYVRLQPILDSHSQVLAPEVVLSHVCYSWRMACLDSSDLWTTFHARHPSRSSLARLQAYLTRSGARLIDIAFDFGSSPEPGISSECFISEIVPHRIRWRRLLISLPNHSEHLASLQSYLTPSHSPNLLSLTILPRRTNTDTLYEHPDDLNIHTPTNSLDDEFPRKAPFYLCMNGHSAATCFPLLRHVTDLRLNVTWDGPIDGNGPVQQMHWLSWKTFLQVLTLPSLVSLSIEGQPYTLPRSAQGTVEKISMPHLKLLRYTASVDSSTFEDLILPNLDAPGLETLTLERMDPPNDPTYWISKSMQPFPSLRTLHLVDFMDYDRSFANSLAFLTSNVGHLVLTGGNPVLGLLSKVATDKLWGGLEKLTLCCPGRRPDTYMGEEIHAVLALTL